MADIANVLAGVQEAQSVFPSGNLRDVILHDRLATAAELATTNSLNDLTSFLTGDLYCWGLPMCQQILDLQRAATLYPAADAIAAGLHVTLHTDS